MATKRSYILILFLVLLFSIPNNSFAFKLFGIFTITGANKDIKVPGSLKIGGLNGPVLSSIGKGMSVDRRINATSGEGYAKALPDNFDNQTVTMDSNVPGIFFKSRLPHLKFVGDSDPVNLNDINMGFATTKILADETFMDGSVAGVAYSSALSSYDNWEYTKDGTCTGCTYTIYNGYSTLLGPTDNATFPSSKLYLGKDGEDNNTYTYLKTDLPLFVFARVKFYSLTTATNMRAAVINISEQGTPSVPVNDYIFFGLQGNASQTNLFIKTDNAGTVDNATTTKNIANGSYHDFLFIMKGSYFELLVDGVVQAYSGDANLSTTALQALSNWSNPVVEFYVFRGTGVNSVAADKIDIERIVVWQPREASY